MPTRDPRDQGQQLRETEAPFPVNRRLRAKQRQTWVDENRHGKRFVLLGLVKEAGHEDALAREHLGRGQADAASLGDGRQGCCRRGIVELRGYPVLPE